MVNDCDWRYLAGVIDTEGSIYMRVKDIKKGSSYFSNVRGKRYTQGKDYHYCLVCVTVHMTSRKFVNYLYKKYGVGRFKKYKRIGYRRDGYYWIIENPEQVVYLLKNILPFLIIKGRQARLGMETLKKKGNAREEDRMLMKKLNRRGRLQPQGEKDSEDDRL